MAPVLITALVVLLLCCAFAVTVRDEPTEGIGADRPQWFTWTTDTQNGK